LEPQPPEAERTREAVKVEDAQAAKRRGGANRRPVNFAFAASSASFINVPSEPSADLVESHGELFWQRQGSESVGGKGIKNGAGKGTSSASIEELPLPSSKLSTAAIEKRL
jgi:hypothetical protein